MMALKDSIEQAGEARSASSADRRLLSPVFEALKQFGGYFVLADETGQEFMIAPKETAGITARSPGGEKQLPLPPAAMRSFKVKAAANELLERINREIALYQLQRTDEEVDDIGLPEAEIDVIEVSTMDADAADRPPLRVRFEPLKGDLPPELQE